MNFSVYTSAKVQNIKRVFTDTFSESEGQPEGEIIGELAYNMLVQTDEKELYCFIAEEDKQIIGAIIFTKMTLGNNANAFILSPIAVNTMQQGKGIGQSLINYGINMLKKDGVELLFTYGDPNYYSKVGYQQISEEQIKAPQKLSLPHGWLCQSLTSNVIPIVKGDTSCVEALNKAEYW